MPNYDITTGEQAVAATGQVTGTLVTATMTTFKTIKLSVRGLAAGKRAVFAIEDTANVTPFSDAIQVAVKHFEGGQPTEGNNAAWATYDIPLTRFGVTNSALGLFCTAIDATPGSVLAHAWLEA
jgi:hypothetical protein